MAAKTPIKATFTGSDVTGLAEFIAADYIPISDGGTGAITAAGARTALDLYSTSEALSVANNLSDVANVITTRTNLDVYSKAEALSVANNLSDVANVITARTNLGVDSSAEVTTKAVNNGITFAIALG
tara:strand:- start:2380 stop:2763 length:384 start_codon:yes stop_codon:yes gene_type:complete